VIVTCYEVQGLPENEFTRPVACDLKDVRVWFWKGHIGHREDVKVTRFWIDGQGQFNVVDPEPTEIVQTPEGIYSLLLSPFALVPSTNAGERVAEERIEIAIGLLASFQRRNIVFRKMFSNSYSFETRQATSSSEPLPMPLSFPPPNLTPEGIRPTLRAERSIWSLNEEHRNRVQLSLRWLCDATFDMGVNAFLKYWFAVETLAMHETSNIAPLNEALREIYALPSRADANERFNVGTLFGIRSRIVHDGKIVPIDGRVLVYLECLYHDVLRHVLSMPSEKRLEFLISASGFDYEKELHRLAL
jgi:hypothetical protein